MLITILHTPPRDEVTRNDTVQQRRDVFAGRIRRLRTPGSRVQRRRHGYEPQSCRHTATSSWTVGQSSQQPVSPVLHPENCSDHPQHRSYHAP